MRIGIMGVHYGHVRGMISSALAAKNAEIVGIVEPEDTLYEGICRTMDIPRFPTLADMLDKARPELILEGCTHPEKTELVEAAAAAGVHVLLDKPLCTGLSDWKRMRQAVDASGIRVSMWFTSRSHPSFMALRESVVAGDLGEIVSIVSTHPHQLRLPARSWYYDTHAYAGTFHDLACHGVDQVRWLTGAEYVGVHAIAACKKYREPRLNDHAQASFQLSDGTGATITADWLTPRVAASWGDTRVIIMGTEGSAHLRAYAANHVLVVSNKKGTFEPTLDTPKHASFVADMITDIENGEEPFISTDDVFAVARACLTAEESIRQGGAFLPIACS
jgi:predicted dehydrogenase